MGSLHLPPGLTQADYHAEAAEYFTRLPRNAARVVFQGKINASFSWAHSPTADTAAGNDGKALLFLGLLFQQGLLTAAPSRAQQALPTSRPRQEAKTGSRIDLFASRGLLQRGVRIFPESCLSLGTDHDLQEGCFALRGTRAVSRPPTRARVWVGGVDKIDRLDQQALVDLAKRCTKPKPSVAYKDSKRTKDALKHARVTKSREAWKQALALRRVDRRQWELDRLRKASQCAWAHFQDVKAPGQGSWDLEFADAQVQDPHVTCRQCTRVSQCSRGIVPTHAASGFTVQEVRQAVSQMSKNKSVGVDLTSRELFEGLLGVPGGDSHLAEFFTNILVTREVPRDWNTSVLILLAKIPPDFAQGPPSYCTWQRGVEVVCTSPS